MSEKRKNPIDKYLKFLPVMRLEIEIPFFSVSTSLMRYHYELNNLSYAIFHVRIFKWRFEINLFDYMERFYR